MEKIKPNIVITKKGVVPEKEEIIIPVYYTKIKGKIIIDEDSMREEFEMKLKEIIKKVG